MTTAKQRSSLVSTIRTGKVPGRRNLFKYLFTLIGEPDAYKQIGFSDGCRGNDKYRVVVICRPDFILTKEKLAKLNEYVTINCIHTNNGIWTNAFNITYSNPLWSKIDRELAGIR